MRQGIGEGARGRGWGGRTGLTGARALLGACLLAAATLASAAPAAASPAPSSAAVASPAPQALTLPRPEGPRRVLLAVPAHAPAGPRPLVILLHGHGGSAAQTLGLERTAAPLSQWLAIGQREGLLVAAPDGLVGGDQKSGWNDCRRDTQTNPTSDDVGLISALIDEAVAHHGADPARVYLMGMSNGGMMALRYAMEAGDRLAGVAAVSASMATDSRCPAIKAPLSLLMVGGTADGIVPWDGGPVGKRQEGRRGRVIGAEATVMRWRERDGLFGEPARSESVPHRDPADPTRAQRTVWGAQPGGLQIELLRIDGGGHVEPSVAHRVSAAYSLLVGHQSGDLEVADEAWSFFRDKRRGLSR